MPATDADPSFFATVLQANSCDIQTFLAAVALIETLREHTPDEVVDRLIHFSHLIRTDPAWLDHLYSDDVWSIEAGFVPSPWGLDLAEMATDAVVKLSSERCLRAFLDALRGIQDTEVAHEFAERLLEVPFGRPQVRWSGPAIFPPAEGGTKRLYRLRTSVPACVRIALSQEQLVVLETLGEHDEFWAIETNVFRLYGIASTRETLLSWLRAGR